MVCNHFGLKQTATEDYAFVCYNDIVREWNDCSLLMHAHRTIGLADFCKTLLTSSQYMQDYPNLAKLAHVALIIPVTSVECERGFSCQNRIKTKLRARLKNPTLDRLIRLAYCKEMFRCDKDLLIALKDWKLKKERRLM